MRVSTVSTMIFGISLTRIAWAWPGSFLISIVYLRCFLDNRELLFLNELHDDILHHIQCTFTQCVLCFYISTSTQHNIYVWGSKVQVRCKCTWMVKGSISARLAQTKNHSKRAVSPHILWKRMILMKILIILGFFTNLLFTEYYKRIINNHERGVIMKQE